MTSPTTPLERIHISNHKTDIEVEKHDENEEILHSSTTTIIPGITTEQIQTSLDIQKQHQHHRHHQYNENIEDENNSLEIFKTKATTTLLTTSANLGPLPQSSSPSPSLATFTTLDISTTPISSMELLTTISSSSNPLVLTNEQNFLNNLNGKKVNISYLSI